MYIILKKVEQNVVYNEYLFYDTTLTENFKPL